MNPKGLISAFLGQYKLYIYIALIAIASTYIVVKVNQYINAQVEKRLTDARNSMLSELQKGLQAGLDDKLNGLSKSMDDGFDKLNKGLNDAKTNIDKQRTQLDSIGDVWLRVDATKGADGNAGDKGKGSQVTGSPAGSNGTYYAKLPESSVQFLKGEAYRADQCAVYLGAAQEALVQYKGAFEKYQQYVREALDQAKKTHDAK
ncbi:i-spanin [Serratia phage Moabite]|uniref:I-spanin n=2 Tax=Moabitevirus moabite TaxID=2846181 RepID=A0A4Y5TPD0_9CAUD|nr:i-spanin [Serratia phage Moabite]QDB71172.1 i-spanin [Serratia phage Moabite]QPX76681.1 putative i-spanin [Serratia phage vB_SmaM_Yaphecito]UCR74673.1 i-spanin [Serratia phage BUCT660]UGO54028.1 hypothetical protein HAYMO_46 [Serratia phage vB_SmaM_Haymo]